MRQREFHRCTLAWLLQAPEKYGVRFADGGVAEFDGTKADVVETTGPYGLAVRLFFDKQARLLGLADRPPRAPARADAQPGAGEKPADKKSSLFRSIEAPVDDPTLGVHVRVAEYRTDDGIRFPHRMVIESYGKDREEWRISRFRVNPKIDLKDFSPQWVR